MDEGLPCILLSLRGNVVERLWPLLAWRSGNAFRTASTHVRQVCHQFLEKSDAELDSTPLPPSLFHPGTLCEEWENGPPFVAVFGPAPDVMRISRLIRWAVSQSAPSIEILEKVVAAEGMVVPKCEILRRFLQLPMEDSQQLRLVQEFMSMCVLSQTVRAGHGSSAGLFKALPVAQRNLFACVDFTRQSALVVGSIAGAGNDAKQYDIRRLFDIWPHILTLAGEGVQPLPKARQDESVPMMRTNIFVQQGPQEEATIGDSERDAFVTAVTFTCRALCDYLVDLRVALKCKDVARSLFQAQEFTRALSFYKLAQWHCPHADSTLYSNAAICFSRSARHHAAVDSAITALLVDENNTKAVHTIVKSELALGYTSCNGWQEDLIEQLSCANDTLSALRMKHKQLRAPTKRHLMSELTAAQHGQPSTTQYSSKVDARLLQLIAEEESGEDGSKDAHRHFLSAAVARGAEGAALPLVDACTSCRDSRVALALLSRGPLTVNMEAALALGKTYDAENLDTFLLYVSTAAASQDPAVLFDAGDTLVKYILSRSFGKWNSTSCYSAWLMACGGQGDRITQLMKPSP